MSREGLLRPPTADGPPREPAWSWRLYGLMAAVWLLLILAWRVSSVAEDSTTPWTTEFIWRGSNALLWLALTPAVFFLTRAFPVPGEHRVRNVAIHGLAAIGLSILHLLIFVPLNHWLIPDFPNHYPSLAAFFANQAVFRTVNGTITYGVLFFVFASNAHYRRARQEERRSDELSRQLAEAQLRALRMQIQPHFLFNTLHSISALIGEAPGEALRMVSRLGDFLRAALERGGAQTVRFEEELQFARLYLDIERVRFGDRLRLSVEASPEALAVQVPTLILQPLVENAIRHGVAPAMGPVDLAVTAAVRDGDLEVRLENVEQGPAPSPRKAEAGDGLGLANTRARLRQAYGEAAALTVESRAPGAFLAVLRLPAGVAHAAA